MKFCTNCGNQLPDEAQFCTNCGTPIGAVNTPEATAVPEQPEAPVTEQPTQFETPSYEQPAQPIYGQPAQAEAPVYEQPAQPVYQQPQYVNAEQNPPYQAPQQNAQGGYYQPPTGNQPPYNNYNYAPNQAPVEEKASVGLAILSFFFPIVGLILFLVKKKDRPKTAKACGIAALVSVAIGIIFSIIGGIIGARAAKEAYDDFDVDSFVEDFSDGDSDDFDWDIFNDATAAEACGTFNDYGYVNEYFDVKYDLPEGFTFESYDEIIGEDEDYFTDAETGIPYCQYNECDLYSDSAAYSDATGTSIQTMIVPAANLWSDDYDAEYLLRELAEGSVEGEESSTISDYYEITCGTTTFKGVDASFTYEDMTMNMSYYVTERDGSYLIVAIATVNEFDSNLPSSYMNLFENAAVG